MAAAAQGMLAAVLLLVSPALLRCSPSSSPGCPQACTCQTSSLMNCSASNLSSVPPYIGDSIVELDFSHNSLRSVTLHHPHHNLRNIWLGNNHIAHLSLCLKGNRAGRYLRGSQGLRQRGQECVSWAPALQLLSVDRNQLQQLPEGLEHMESLHILQLSFNKLSTLRKEALSNLHQLKELYLQHNLITRLHPQTFQDLVQLKVLDLSFNMLTSLHLSIFLPLRNIQADVRLSGNRWHCDCNMRSLRRWIIFDSSQGLQSWSVVCASPSVLSGKDIQELEEDDLNCFSGENIEQLHRDVAIERGAEILLSCSAQDSVWWTPKGQLSANQPSGDLLLKDTTSRDTGLYVCVSEGQVVAVYNLQISQVGSPKRGRRDLPSSIQQRITEDTPNALDRQLKSRAAQSDLALAVCLSIFLTFLVAFVLGVLARPCIDVFWQGVSTRRNTNAATTASSVERTPYDNDAYSSNEEPEIIGPFRERRVTYSTVEYTEENNVRYYDTVAGGEQEGLSTKAAKRNSDGDSESERSMELNKYKGGKTFSDGDNASQTHDMEFEPIPEPTELEERRRFSSSSESSVCENGSRKQHMAREDNTTPSRFQQVTESVQQQADFSSNTELVGQKILHKRKTEIARFPSEPFREMSPHTDSSDILQENEYAFEFSNSSQSNSVKSSSLFGSFDDSKQRMAPSSDKQKTYDTSTFSASSDTSDGEHYTNNTDKRHKRDVHLNLKTPKADQIRSSERDSEVSIIELDPSLSFEFSDSDKKPGHGHNTQKTMPGRKWPRLHSREPSSPSGNLSSSNSESDNTVTDRIVENTKGQTRGNRVKNHQDNCAPLSDSQSSSSDESVDQSMKSVEKKGAIHLTDEPSYVGSKWSAVDVEHVPRPKNNLEIKTSSPASRSLSISDSDDEGTHYVQRHTLRRVATEEALFHSSPTSIRNSLTQSPHYNTVHIPGTQKQVKYNEASNSSSSDSENERVTPDSEERKWPVIDLQHIPRSKRRLDIKTMSPVYDAFSSTSIKIKKQDDLFLPRLQTEVSHTSKGQGSVEFLKSTSPVKRHLDITAQSSFSDSSFSSDDTFSKRNIKQEQKEVQGTQPKTQPGSLGSVPKKKRQAPLPPQPSMVSKGHAENTRDFRVNPEEHIVGVKSSNVKTEHYALGTGWPIINLQSIPHLKRHLDIKAFSSQGSSNSDSEDETIKSTKPKQKLDKSSLKSKVSQTEISESRTGWPALDLYNIKPVKRHIEFKVASPSWSLDSSFSSKSKDETLEISTMDFERITQIKQRQDVKVLPRSSDSSSSSENEDEMTGHTKKQAVELGGAKWPLVNLERTARLKRRLDIKTPSLSKDTSSICESDEKTTKNQMEKERLEMLGNAKYPLSSFDLQTRWPIIDLRYVRRIKKRLDIKPFQPVSISSSRRSIDYKIVIPPNKQEKLVLGTSSSSESDDETTNKMEKERLEMLGNHKYPLSSFDLQTRWPIIDLRYVRRIKKRLDIKPFQPVSISSSRRSIDYKIVIPPNKQEEVLLDTSIPPVLSLSTAGQEKDTQWPAIDVERTARVRRHLEFKLQSRSSESSSSSSSEDEITKPVNKHVNVELYQQRPPTQASTQQWPLVNLERTARLKRRLDIKTPSPSKDTSSSSESDDETTKNQMEKERLEMLGITRLPSGSFDLQTRWPIIDLRYVPRIKKRLDIKPFQPLSISSSRRSIDYKIVIPPNKQEKIDLGTSSSSESDDETTNKMEKERIEMLGNHKYPLSSFDLQTRWPIIDLRYVPHIKKRLDIKPFQPVSISSSRRSIDYKFVIPQDKQEEVLLDTSIPSVSSFPTAGQEKDTQWPAVDVERTARVRRHLEFKLQSRSSESSSSSSSEDEITKPVNKHVNVELYQQRPPTQASTKQWPLVNLERTARLKRRLDIKTPSPSKDTSSSSESDDETTKNQMEKERLEMLGITRLPSGSFDLQTKWPIIDLRYVPRIKKRLDIKPFQPLSISSSRRSIDYKIVIPPNKQEKIDLGTSSSSESDDETTNKMEKERLEMLGNAKYPLSSFDLQTRWPIIDLRYVPRIKKHLDIKPFQPVSISSSRRSIDYKIMIPPIKQEEVLLDTSIPPVSPFPTAGQEKDTQWPAVDVERTARVRRHLEFKLQSRSSESSSSSSSEDEITKPVNKHVNVELYQQRPPTQASTKQWPLVNLEQTTRLKRHLDIKTPSPSKDTSSSSESDDETTNKIEKERLEMLGNAKYPLSSFDLQTRWPIIDLRYVPRIKKRLDIKPFQPVSISSSRRSIDYKIVIPPNKQEVLLGTSSSSESDDETTNKMEKQRLENLRITRFPSGSYDLQTRWPIIDLQYVHRITRRLDIKPFLPVSISSSSSIDDSNIAIPPNKQEEVLLGTLIPPVSSFPTAGPEKDTQWPVVDLERKTGIKWCLNFKVQSQSSESSSSSESDNETTDHTNKLQTEKFDITTFPIKKQDSGASLTAVDLKNVSNIPTKDPESSSLIYKMHLTSSPTHGSSSSSDESDNSEMEAKDTVVRNWSQMESHPVTNLVEADTNVTYKPYNIRRLDVKVLSQEMNFSNRLLPSQQSESGSSTSESGDENEEHNAKVVSQASVKDLTGSPVLGTLSHSSKKDPNIKLEKYNTLIDGNTTFPPEVNPELQSRWATMNLGFSRFRKRLEISSNKPDKVDSPHFLMEESETGTIASRARQRRFLALKKLMQADSSETVSQEDWLSNSVAGNEIFGSDYSISMNDYESKANTETTSSDISYRNVDVVMNKNSQITSSLRSLSRSSSSSSEAEMDPSVPDLTFGVPHIKRRLNIKAPSAEPSQSLSSPAESEKWMAADTGIRQEQETYDSLITYKRLIMKTPSLPGDTSLMSSIQTTDYSNEEYTATGRMTIRQEEKEEKVVVPKKALSLQSFDDLFKKIKHPKHKPEMPPDIRWTGIGHHQLDLSSSPPSKSTASTLLSPQESPPRLPEVPPPESSNSSSSESDAEDSITTSRGKYSSLSVGGGSLTPSGASYKFDQSVGGTHEPLRVVSVERSGLRGLSALKAKFHERQMWDSENTDHTESRSPVGSNSGDRVDATPFSQQPLTPTHLRAEQRDLHYDISQYRKYKSDEIEPLEAPPPVPETPLPDF